MVTRMARATQLVTLIQIERSLETRLVELEERVKYLENRGIDLSKAQILKLESGDVVIFKLTQPLSTSEIERMAEEWRNLMQAAGHPDVQAMFLGGNNVQVGVVRA